MGTEMGPTLREEQLEKLEEFRENHDQHGEAGYLEELFPDETEIAEMVYIRDTFETSRPEEYSEMIVAKSMSEDYSDMLERNPDLYHLGFNDDMVWDPTQY